MRNAEHLAVVSRPSAALAPCFNVVGVRFVELINPGPVCVVANRTERAIGFLLRLCRARLLFIDRVLGCIRTRALQEASYLEGRRSLLLDGWPSLEISTRPEGAHLLRFCKGGAFPPHPTATYITEQGTKIRMARLVSF